MFRRHLRVVAVNVSRGLTNADIAPDTDLVRQLDRLLYVVHRPIFADVNGLFPLVATSRSETASTVSDLAGHVRTRRSLATGAAGVAYGRDGRPTALKAGRSTAEKNGSGADRRRSMTQRHS